MDRAELTADAYLDQLARRFQKVSTVITRASTTVDLGAERVLRKIGLNLITALTAQNAH